MKRVRSITSIILSFVLVLTAMFASVGTLTAKAADGVTIIFHYLRSDGAYADWDMWIWEDTGEGTANAFTKEGDKGMELSYKVAPSTQKVGFLVRKPDWSEKDTGDDRFVEIGGATEGTINVYLKTGEAKFDTVFGDDVKMDDKIIKAYIDGEDYQVVKAEMSKAPDDPNGKYEIKCGDNKVEIDSASVDGSVVSIKLKNALDPLMTYMISYNGMEAIAVKMPDFYSTKAFEDKYTYDGNDLGANYAKDKTVFKVWAPTASEMTLNLYDNGEKTEGENVEQISMTLGEKGVWSVEKSGDLNGKYYTYTALFPNGNKAKNVVDPYARTVGVNGDRGMVIDLEAASPAGWAQDTRCTVSTPVNLFIYELHIRDFSSHADSGIPAEHVGKYLAFTDKGTKTPNGTPTGIDHLVDLGVNAVHILPSYDFGSIDETASEGKYNWGYDPKNYNAPEGSYSTDPYHGEVRVKEYKQMVQALHNENIGVVMDVVYNHTQSSSYCFNKLVPNYFFRPNSNASGCGNDVATERSMVRKFIVDSVVYWAEEYHLDGFRFDLMAILDVDTMNAIRAAVDKIDPTIVLYGEGWWASAPKWTKEGVKGSLKADTKLLNNIAAFSDDIRDGIKGSVFNAKEKGYANGNIGKRSPVLKGVLGNQDWAPNPTQCVNYAACHDNNTLWDVINTSNADDPEDVKIKQNLMAAAIYMTAQGIPFTLAGEELLRTKSRYDNDGNFVKFDENSHASPDSVNAIDYTRLEKYPQVYEYYKGLIALRKAHAGFRMTTADDVNKYLTYPDDIQKGVITYSIKGAPNEVSDEIFVAYNPLSEEYKVTLPEGEWDILVNGEKAGTTSLGKASGEVSLTPLSAYVFVKGKLAPEKLESDFVKGAKTPASNPSSSSTSSTSSSTTSEDEEGGNGLKIFFIVVIGVIAVVFIKKKVSN